MQKERHKLPVTVQLKEEIDINILEKDLEVKHVMNRKVGSTEYIDFVLTANKWTGNEKIMEPEKCDKLQWYPLNKLPENIIDFEKKLLEENNDFYIPWGWDET